jgi:hypothetical protein
MRITIIILFNLFALQSFGQWSKIDSVIVNKREYIYNKADYKIGHDSIQEIKMVWSDGIEIDTHYTKKLVSRTVYRFITTDSLTPYLLTSDFDEVAEDKIGDKFVVSGYLEKSYNDGTGVTTVNPDTTGTIGLATKADVLGISSGSGLSAEQVFDTTAYTIKLGEGLQKTKDDTGDSVLIELKLKDALERIVWSTGSHKMVFMPGNTTSATATWGVQVTVTGTVTAPGKSTSSKFMFSNRWETLVTTPSTTAVAGFRCNTQNYGFGNSAGMGGYYLNGVTGPATGVTTTTHRYFFGMTQSIANPTDAQPSAQISCFGIGYDAADANLQFMHNDASGTCTKVDLGSNFPVPTSDRSSFWRLIMYSPSNTQEVYYKVIDMLDGDVYTGVATTDLPAKTDIFSPRGYASVGGTSSVIGFAIQQLEIFCDF